jgi:integrase
VARPKKEEKFRMTRFTNASGSKSWRVSGTGSDGRRVRKNFKFKADAIEMMADKEAELTETSGARRHQQTTLDSNQISDAEAAIQGIGGRQLSHLISHYLALEARARSKGLNLDSALEFVESRHRPELTEISVLNARDKFLSTRTGRAEKTVSFYESCTKQLLKPDPNKLLHTIEVSDIETILDRYDNFNSMQAHRRAFSVFFNWGVRQHLCLENPCHRLDQQPRPNTPVAILSLEEVLRLLQAAVDYKEGVMVPVVAIALFAGLRPSEIADLTPADLRTESIRVSGGKMRNSSKRMVPLTPNLKTWLKSYPFKGVPEALRYRMKVLKNATNALCWLDDILRHTSISYQAERDKNEDLTTFNNRTSKEMMDRHYREVIESPSDLAEFWAMTPASLRKKKLKVKLPGTQDKKWPSKAKLKKLVWERSMVRVAKDLGVSDVAVKKHCTKLGLKLPPMGYWLRRS